MRSFKGFLAEMKSNNLICQTAKFIVENNVNPFAFALGIIKNTNAFNEDAKQQLAIFEDKLIAEADASGWGSAIGGAARNAASGVGNFFSGIKQGWQGNAPQQQPQENPGEQPQQNPIKNVETLLQSLKGVLQQSGLGSQFDNNLNQLMQAISHQLNASQTHSNVAAAPGPAANGSQTQTAAATGAPGMWGSSTT